jgi:SAM-dependent methyltransferase
MDPERQMDKSTPYGDQYHSMVRRNYPLKSWLRDLFATWKQPAAFAGIIDALPQGARVLDAGCGQGTVLANLAAYRPDLQLFGVDEAPAGVVTGATLLTGDVMRLPFPEGDFDLVFSRQVLEHVPDNLGMIRELTRVLRSGGRLYIDCPDVRNAMSWAPLNFWEDPTHLRPYTRKGLRRLFQLCGLEPRTTGRVRDWRLVLLGAFYLPVAWLSRDPFFVRHWLANITGVFIYGTAIKP